MDSLRSLNAPNKLKILVISSIMLLSHLLNVVKFYRENGNQKRGMTKEIEILNSIQ